MGCDEDRRRSPAEAENHAGLGVIATEPDEARQHETGSTPVGATTRNPATAGFSFSFHPVWSRIWSPALLRQLVFAIVGLVAMLRPSISAMQSTPIRRR